MRRLSYLDPPQSNRTLENRTKLFVARAHRNLVMYYQAVNFNGYLAKRQTVGLRNFGRKTNLAFDGGYILK